MTESTKFCYIKNNGIQGIFVDYFMVKSTEDGLGVGVKLACRCYCCTNFHRDCHTPYRFGIFQFHQLVGAGLKVCQQSNHNATRFYIILLRHKHWAVLPVRSPIKKGCLRPGQPNFQQSRPVKSLIGGYLCIISRVLAYVRISGAAEQGL